MPRRTARETNAAPKVHTTRVASARASTPAPAAASDLAAEGSASPALTAAEPVRVTSGDELK